VHRESAFHAGRSSLIALSYGLLIFKDKVYILPGYPLSLVVKMEVNEQDIKRFLDIKRVNDASPKTIKQQGFVLNQLNDFLKAKPFKEVSEQEIFAFLSYKKQTLARSSIHIYKFIMKSFYRFLYGLPRHQYPDQVINLNGGNNKRKVPIRPEDLITKNDIASLLKYCSYYRDEAMIVTLYESACRLGEFVNMNIEHLNFDDKGIVLVVSGKTGERRIRLIESVPYLQKWLENHPLKEHKGSNPLWCALKKPHNRITNGSVALIMKKIKSRSGISKKLNPHNFRHSRLTELAKYLSDSKLKVFAGWTGNSSMTGVYVHLSGVDLDGDLFRIAGVDTEEEKMKVSPLKVKKCERCQTENPGTAEFCVLCGMPFNKALLVKDTLEIQELKEKVKVTGDVTDSMWKVIDELKKEIKELKANR